jgi:hypothetical protein
MPVRRDHRCNVIAFPTINRLIRGLGNQRCWAVAPNTTRGGRVCSPGMGNVPIICENWYQTMSPA